MAREKANKMDAEYMAMRRRMSRLRVKCGKQSSMEAEDVQGNENETGFKDLVKFWKKHGIPIAKDLLSDMDEETAKKATRRRGRRRSKELEDLHLSASTGHLKLNNVAEEQEDDENEAEIKPTVTQNKPKVSTVNPKKPLRKAQSEFVLSKSKASAKQTNGLSPSLRRKLERQSSKN